MTEEETQQLRKEETRRAVRRHLVERPAMAQLPRTIRRSLTREIQGITDDEVTDACIFLESLRQVEKLTEHLGATKYYRATATGTLAHERDN